MSFTLLVYGLTFLGIVWHALLLVYVLYISPGFANADLDISIKYPKE